MSIAVAISAASGQRIRRLPLAPDGNISDAPQPYSEAPIPVIPEGLWRCSPR